LVACRNRQFAGAGRAPEGGRGVDDVERAVAEAGLAVHRPGRLLLPAVAARQRRADVGAVRAGRVAIALEGQRDVEVRPVAARGAAASG